MANTSHASDCGSLRLRVVGVDWGCGGQASRDIYGRCAGSRGNGHGFRYKSDFSISVNVSPVQLLSTDLDCKQWLEKLAQLKIPSQALVIEITERMLLESDKISDENINTLQTAGIELALDDFGTGYSSLSYLKRFDIDYIKIDRSFVCNLHRASEDVALCQAIIVMAHQLGIQVVAEGVETQEQHSILLEAGCDFGQGYWYCKPITATEMTQRLVQENLKI